MIAFDLHTHTNFSDGENTPEEMIEAALKRGLTCLGISDHSYTSFDPEPCVPKERLEERREVMAALKEKYRDRIRLCCGIEQDIDSDFPAEGCDYVIGSVHYLLLGGEYCHVDYLPKHQRETVERYFSGDWYAYTAAYFEKVSEVVERTNCDIIGHFDLVSKFNEKEHLFDEKHPRYVAAWRAALDRLLPYGKPFEINTGAISRRWRTTAYPNAEMIDYIRSHGGKLLLSSDAHSAESLCFAFEQYETALGDCLLRRAEDVLCRTFSTFCAAIPTPAAASPWARGASITSSWGAAKTAATASLRRRRTAFAQRRSTRVK